MCIKIGWKNYEIINKKEIYVDNKECYGCIKYDEEEIHLRNTNSKKQNNATLIHELIHGIDDMYSIGLEEEDVVKLANGIYTLITDNGFTIEGCNNESTT